MSVPLILLSWERMCSPWQVISSFYFSHSCGPFSLGLLSLMPLKCGKYYTAAEILLRFSARTPRSYLQGGILLDPAKH